MGFPFLKSPSILGQGGGGNWLFRQKGQSGVVKAILSV